MNTENYEISILGKDIIIPSWDEAKKTIVPYVERNVSFLLYIQIGYLGNNNKIRVTGVSDGVLVDSNANRANGGENGWYDMAQGDSMILRYCNGHYYTVQYRT